MRSFFYLQRERGFTLVELLVVIGIIGILLGLSTYAYSRLRVKIDVEAAQTSVAESLRRAETLARASQGDSAWGVYVQSSGLTIFKGSNYAGRDLAADEITEFAERVSVAQNYEVVFTKMVAEPQWTGTISLSAGGITRSVDVGVKGVIQK